MPCPATPRDLLHPDDLIALLQLQLEAIEGCSGMVFNAGGGRDISVSLQELTALCREASGREVPVGSEQRTSAVDVPLYITDHRRVTGALGWRPVVTPAEIVGGIVEWVRSDMGRSRRMFSNEEGTG